MKEVYQYLQLEKDYDKEFVEFLIGAAKATVENYCNQIIFRKEIELDVDIYAGRGVVPISYVINVLSVKKNGQDVNYQLMRENSVYWLVCPQVSGIVTARVDAGITPIPRDIALVVAELVQTNYNNSRSQNLGVDSRTVNVGGSSNTIRYLDLSGKHKNILARYTRWSI